MGNKNYALVDFTVAAVDVAIAASGTSTHPCLFWGLAALLFGVGLANLAAYVKEE